MKLILFACVLTLGLTTGCSLPAGNTQPSTPTDDRQMADQFMQTAQAFVQSAVGSGGNVQVIIHGDEATLIGYVDSLAAKNKAEAAALKDSSINTVKNRIIVN